jgi:hypothetical protein
MKMATKATKAMMMTTRKRMVTMTKKIAMTAATTT